MHIHLTHLISASGKNVLNLLLLNIIVIKSLNSHLVGNEEGSVILLFMCVFNIMGCFLCGGILNLIVQSLCLQFSF